jgi:hypothetical protein
VLVLLALLATPAAAGPNTGPRWVTTALKQLSSLQVHPLAAKTGYSRAQFGTPWKDFDGNRCDTRNDILQRDLKQIVYKAGSSCVVASGRLHDPYTGKTVAFVRGPNSGTVQIDHVVALGDAWATGAATWSAERRLQYVNDPLVLLAVDGSANEAKGDGDAFEWLPPNRKFDCKYVARQISLKTKYQLWATVDEWRAMRKLLQSCSR